MTASYKHHQLFNYLLQCGDTSRFTRFIEGDCRTFTTYKGEINDYC